MTFTLNTPLDMHLHLRQGDMLKLVAPLSAQTFSGAVVMPNLVPPLSTREQVLAYKNEILEATQAHEPFTPLMTVFFKPYNREELMVLKDSITGIKLYPQGATTNSEGGLKDLQDAEQTLKYMEELKIPLMVHGEEAGAFVMDREKLFMPIFESLAQKYPKLMIIMEHITTASAVELLDKYDNLYATVTLQHLLITLDDVAGGLLSPHLFCKPIAKRPEDREALLGAALRAHPKLSFGSDSAPHPKHAKECCGCAAGVFSAPIALQRLVQLFDEHDALHHLQAFVSDNAIKNYKLDLPSHSVSFEKVPFSIPAQYGEVVPFEAGKELSWTVIES
ncbi:MAG: dihydroorotase [Planctomycetes bacterium]|nr:dihydroorotase [Planctomycetota bacterium]